MAAAAAAAAGTRTVFLPPLSELSREELIADCVRLEHENRALESEIAPIKEAAARALAQLRQITEERNRSLAEQANRLSNLEQRIAKVQQTQTKTAKVCGGIGFGLGFAAGVGVRFLALR